MTHFMILLLTYFRLTHKAIIAIDQGVISKLCNISISPGKSTWIPAFTGMTIHVKWLSPVIPAKAGIQ